MALFSKDSEQIVNDAIAFMRANTVLTADSPGAKFRTLVEIIRTELNDAYATFDANTAIAMIYGARGKYLDFLGEMFKVYRIKSSAAGVDSEHENIKFYTKSGATFSSINSNSNFTIPKGTKVWAQRDGNNLEFILTQDLLVNKTVTEAFASAKALRNGVEYNVATGAINQHNFTSYADSINSSLLVTNVQAVDNGIDTESDENYRYRIMNSRLQDLSANKTAVTMAALAVPGVADVEILDKYFGIGTSAVLIKSTTPTVSDNLVAEVQVAIDSVKGEGIDLLAMKPVYSTMKFVIGLNYKEVLSAQEELNIENAVKQTVVNTVNNLDVGQGFSINELANAILLTDSRIKSIGTPNKFFNRIYVIKTTRSGATIINEIQRDYSVSQFNKLIISTDIDAVSFV